VIYFQECVFNFVTFYNLVLKQGTHERHQQHYSNSQYKRPNTIIVRDGARNPIRRKSTDEMRDDSSSKKEGTTGEEGANHVPP
jgi:hypothetical protein